jgi:hypothetical protein
MTDSEWIPPEGYRYEWVRDDSWEMGGDGRTCRMKGCKEPAVARLRRSHRNKSGFKDVRLWAYCEAHLYGRKIEDGAVKSRRLVQDAEEIST